MKTDVEKLDPTRVRLSVEVPFAELEVSLAKAYRTIGGQIRVPGFRPGKVPARIIDARVGRGAILEEAINDALPRLYGQAVEETGVQAVGQPEVDITQIDDGNQLSFTAEVEIRPEFDLPSFDDLEVTVDPIEVTDDEVDEQVESLRERFASQTTVERPAEDGDFVTIDLFATRDGEPLEGGQTSGQTYRVGSGSMLDGLDEAVRGLSAGESATFTATLLGDQEGQEAQVTVTVQTVKSQELPELDDEFAQLASEFDTVEEMRTDLRTRLLRAKRAEQFGTIRDKVLQVYLDRANVAVPSGMLEHEFGHRKEAITNELQSYGLTTEQYLEAQGMTAEEFEADTREKSALAIRGQFVLDAVANQEQLTVDEGELTATLINRAQRSGISPDEYVRQVLQSGNVQALVGEVVRNKALARLMEEARVVDTNGDEVDLMVLQAALAPPGSADADDEDLEDDSDSTDDVREQPQVAAPPVDESISIDVPFFPEPDDAAGPEGTGRA